MVRRSWRWFVFGLALAALTNVAAQDQAPMPVPAPPAQPPLAEPLPQDQLDALLAPIALYPDQLLAQVLMAATYPLEVVQAARWLQENPNVKGDALDQALRDKNWDPSVLSLTAFPQVLAMMNDKLDWTQQLGDAFLANQAQVMDTVQKLRAKAQEAGNLVTTPQQTVVNQGSEIYIQPAQPEVVYVPVYDPYVIYGPWWVPAYRPWYWYPPPMYGYPPPPPAFTVGIFWGIGWGITASHWGWAAPVWHRGGSSIHITTTNNYFLNRPRYRDQWHEGRWEHLPEHRKGVAYRDPAARDRYLGTNDAAIRAREPYRGHDLPRPVPQPFPHAVPPPRPEGRPLTQSPAPRPMPDSSRPAPHQFPQSAPPLQSAPRPMPPPQQSAPRPLPPPQQSAPRAPSQFQQSTPRPLPPPQQAIPRAAPLVQRPPPPTAWSPQPRAEVQRDSSRGQASRQAAHGAPPGGKR
jgi:hypothetical protein